MAKPYTAEGPRLNVFAPCMCPFLLARAHVNPCPFCCRARVRGTQCCSHALRAQPHVVVCHWEGGACQPEVSCLSASGPGAAPFKKTIVRSSQLAETLRGLLQRDVERFGCH